MHLFLWNLFWKWQFEHHAVFFVHFKLKDSYFHIFFPNCKHNFLMFCLYITEIIFFISKNGLHTYLPVNWLFWHLPIEDYLRNLHPDRTKVSGRSSLMYRRLALWCYRWLIERRCGDVGRPRWFIICMRMSLWWRWTRWRMMLAIRLHPSDW